MKKINIIRKENEKKGRRSKKQGKKHYSGKALLQSTIFCVGSYSAFFTPFTIHIAYKNKFGLGISHGVL